MHEAPRVRVMDGLGHLDRDLRSPLGRDRHPVQNAPQRFAGNDLDDDKRPTLLVSPQVIHRHDARVRQTGHGVRASSRNRSASLGD